MNRTLTIIIVVVLVLVGGYALWAWPGSPVPEALGFAPSQSVASSPQVDGAQLATGTQSASAQSGSAQSSGVSASDTGTTPILARDRVVAEAEIVPLQYAALSLASSGTVAEVLAQEGQQLAAGDPIARLQADREVIAVAQAQAAVNGAQAQLDALIAGARPEEIDAAQAAVDGAQAQLDMLLAGARPEDLAALQAAVTGAQGAYNQVAEGASEQEIIAARADLASMQTAVTVAQRAYDQVSFSDDVGAMPQSQALQNATTQLEAAQARYNDLMAGARPSQFTQAAAAIDQAQAQLDRAEAGPIDAEIAAAQAEVDRAQAQLDLVTAGARPEEILAAQADVAAAQTALMQAQVNLRDKELRAPFAGTLAALDLKVGQQASAGMPVAQLGDETSWLVETTDLTELDIPDIGVGDPVLVEVDALPDAQLTGRVLSIKPLGENVMGDIIYKVTIALDEGDPRLKWKMTASASIEP